MRSGLKPAVAVVLGCLLLFAVAACGGGSSSGGSSEPSSEAAAAEDISGKVVVWDTEYESLPRYTEAIRQLDDEFEQLHPEVSIERVAQPLEEFETIYRTAFAAHEGPDVMMFQPGASRAFAQGMEDISDRVTPEMKEKMLFWELSSPNLESGGEHFAVPIGSFGYAWYYNKKMFKEAGLPTDFQPETWDELRETAEALKAKGVEPFVAGNKEGAENLYWFSMALENGASEEEIRELALGKIPWTSDFVAKAFQPEIEMQEAGVYPQARFTTSLFTEAYGQFAEGKGAMILGFSNGIGYWGEFNEALGEKNVGTFLTPGLSQPVGLCDGWEIGIPTFAANKEAAWALVEFDSSRKAQEVLQTVGGLVSNWTDTDLPSSFPAQPNFYLQEARQRGVQIIPNTVMPTPVVYGPLESEMNEVLQGRISLAEAQQAMQEAAERSG
ncbi:MAG: extracellular solute-binding protein [Solirubrobacterales bacterium]